MHRLRFIVLLVALCCVSIASAQSGISVKSFKELTQDLDARVNYPVIDQNGQKCALVKVVTTENDFSFDNGQLGVTKAIHKPELSEWWVYLPAKTMKLKIMHPMLGQLKDSEDGFYYFPSPLKEAACYRMELTTGKVTVVVEEERLKTGYFIIDSDPQGADVYITEHGVENYVGITPTQKKLSYGTYNYRVKKSLYHDEVGVAVIDSSRLMQKVVMRPAFGSLKVESVPSGAKVTIADDTRTYITPCTIYDIPSGRHKVSVIASGFALFTREVEILDGQQTELVATLDARFAEVVINTLPEATISINGLVMGKGNYKEDLAEGIYDIEVSLDSHRSATRQIEVVAKEPQIINLEPTPIYGSLDILSEPMFVNVTIHGKSYGDTPLSVDEMLVGDYEVVLSKKGCQTVTKHVTITENNHSLIEANLSNDNLKSSDNTSEELHHSYRGNEKRSEYGSNSDKGGVLNSVENKNKVYYKGMIDFSYGLAAGVVPHDNIGISTTHGCTINKYLFVGAGVGVNFKCNYNIINIPVYADVKASLPIKNTKFSPFADVRVGYSLLNLKGLYFNPSLGVRVGGKRAGCLISVGYELQSTKLSYNFEGDTYSKVSVGTINFRLGLEF